MLWPSHSSYGSEAWVQSSWSSAQGGTRLQSTFLSGAQSLLPSSHHCWQNSVPCCRRTEVLAFLLTVSQGPLPASRGPHNSLPYGPLTDPFTIGQPTSPNPGGKSLWLLVSCKELAWSGQPTQETLPFGYLKISRLGALITYAKSFHLCHIM